MKLRTSFFDKTVLQKDITRFAPLWAIYFIGGLLIMLNVADSTIDNGYYAANHVGQTISYFAIINLIYAGLAAQLIFGDLFNSRLCNALHAMPMRRENWLVTHTVAGLLFSLVPNSVGIFLVMFRLGAYWYVALIWLLGMTMQYLFFFGLAVFSVFCTGNRFAMVAVYGILNFAAMIALWFAQVVYQPMLYGIDLPTEPFSLLCPIVQITMNDEMLLWDDQIDRFVGFGEGWIYLAVLSILGAGLLVLSAVMYRRRRLEVAGDFIAVAPLAPVFSVVFTLCVGAVFASFGELVGNSYVPYLLVGLLVGWFSGRMLLQRTVKVFSGKNFLRLAILVVAVLASVGLTKLDPLGITRWTPDAEQVKSLSVSDNRVYYGEGDVEVKDPQKIQAFIDIHRYVIENGEIRDGGLSRKVSLFFSYKMKDGRTVKRNYQAWVSDGIYAKLQTLCSDVTVYFPYEDWRSNPRRLRNVEVDGQDLGAEHYESLLSAIIKDCEEGNMAYSWQYHDDTGIKLWIAITYIRDDGVHDVREVRVFGESRHTIAWLKENQDAWFNQQNYGDMDISQILGK